MAAYPYLCRSALMDVTPGTRKSKGGTGYPSFSTKGSMNPPRQASTWKGSPRRAAHRPMSSMGSTTPWG